MKTLEQLYTEVLASKELQQEFIEAYKAKNVVNFLKKYDCPASEEELSDFFKKKFNKTEELTDDDLAGVAGGCTPSEVGFSFVTMGFGCIK